MSGKQDQDQQLRFNFFPEQEEAISAPAEKELFDSEEDALDSIITSAQETEDSWPPADPDDSPCGCIPEKTRETAPAQDSSSAPLPLRALRRIALGFLAAGNPDGLGASVRGLLPRMTVDAASFELTGCEIRKTRIILTAEDPAQCLMPAARREKLEAELSVQLTKKEELEAKIRETEPELNASLFVETAVWEYEKSKMAKYHRCLRKIEKLRHDLLFSGKLERVIAEKIADENYILFPENTEIPAGLPPEWGVLFAGKNYETRIVRPPVQLDISAEARLKLALFTAASARDGMLFANGIACSDGKAVYSNPPRKRPVLFRA